MASALPCCCPGASIVTATKRKNHKQQSADEFSKKRKERLRTTVLTSLHDLELLRTLLQTRLRYLGCLGPRQRTEKLLADLADEVPGIHLGQLYAPAGLDIGADTPTEVAFSIVAEINAVLSGREGGLLRKRKGPITHPHVVTLVRSRRLNQRRFSAKSQLRRDGPG